MWYPVLLTKYCLLVVGADQMQKCQSGDPSIFLNPYGGGIADYKIPGPSVWTG